jgi:cation diffusion facilitator CzcD-associated flavoprotein CzcO
MHPSVVIVGAGFGGIAAAIELREHGFDDLTILEKAPQVGGTWWYNSYPGCACDVPSHLYSFSFAQRSDWSRLCSPHDEILRYLQDVARDFGVDRLVVDDAEVTSCTWDDVERRWTVEAHDWRRWPADAVIIATGQLHQPAFPEFDGSFAGHSFHSSRWDHDYDLRGKRVAVIGTGASAIQFVPEVARQASRLYVFQRTGNWFFPRKNHAYPRWLRAVFTYAPGIEALRRWGLFHYAESLTLMIRNPRTWGRIGWARSAAFMRWQLRRSPDLRHKVWPDYTFGCKRILFSSWFLPALTRENVELVTEPIARLSGRTIVTADGEAREVDCIVYGTGFRTTKFMFPMEITGTGGRSLRDAWASGPHAHLGIAVPGFPSLFLMYGPNTNTSGGSMIFYEEVQAAYIRQALEQVRNHGAAAIEVRAEVETASDRETQNRFAGTAWTRCDSWYRDDTGRIVTNWPGYMRDYAREARTLDPGQYRLVHPRDHPSPLPT